MPKPLEVISYVVGAWVAIQTIYSVFKNRRSRPFPEKISRISRKISRLSRAAKAPKLRHTESAQTKEQETMTPIKSAIRRQFCKRKRTKCRYKNRKLQTPSDWDVESWDEDYYV